MASYFAVFMPVREGGYAVEFPDIPEAFTQSETLEECMIMGADILSIAAEEYARARKSLPTPSPLEEIEAWAETQKKDTSLASSGKFVFQLFRAPDMDMKPIRISVSLPKAVLEEIDIKAKQAGYTRSGFLVRAARAWQPEKHALQQEKR